MTTTTRSQLLTTARSLFAERGFDGVSIAQIATELSVTKQALLHHFGSKEKLYGEVLRGISEEFEVQRKALKLDGLEPKAALSLYLLSMLPHNAAETERTRLLMRELLDNQRRAESAKNWYLADFLDGLIGMVLALPGWGQARPMQALALAYQLLGAINYYAVSGPTLGAIFGEKDAERLAQEFRPQLEALLDTALSQSPVGTRHDAPS
jgi:AcrR family transcriptional regulator